MGRPRRSPGSSRCDALSGRPTTYPYTTMPNPITEAREIAATMNLSVLQTAPGKYRLLEEADGGHLVPVSGAPTTARELRAFLEGVEYGRRPALAD